MFYLGLGFKMSTGLVDMRVGRDTVTRGIASISGKERLLEVKFQDTSSGGCSEVDPLAAMATS